MSRKSRRAVAVCVIATVTLLAVVAVPTVGNRLNGSTASNIQSNRTHSLTLRKAWDDLVRRPVFGIGLADFGPQLGEAPLTSGAHSTYLTVGAELGLIGLASLLAALLATARALVAGVRRGSADQRALALGLAAGYAGLAAAAALYDLLWDDFQWVIAGTVLGVCAPLAPRLRRRLADPGAPRRWPRVVEG